MSELSQPPMPQVIAFNMSKGKMALVFISKRIILLIFFSFFFFFPREMEYLINLCLIQQERFTCGPACCCLALPAN